MSRLVRGKELMVLLLGLATIVCGCAPVRAAEAVHRALRYTLSQDGDQLPRLSPAASIYQIGSGRSPLSQRAAQCPAWTKTAFICTRSTYNLGCLRFV